MARPVRQREDQALRPERRPGRALQVGADRASRSVRVRGQARHDHRSAQGYGRAHRRRQRDHRDGSGKRRTGGHTGPAAPRSRGEGRGQVVVLIMNLSELFVRRPVMTVLVMAGILIFGLASYRLLPVSSLPNVDFPTIQVSATLPGASPETMAAAVATPLEKQFSTIAGIDQMTSLSGQGLTSITIQFSLDRDIDAAAQDVNSAIAAATKQLPPTMTTPPSFRKVNPA